MAKKQKLKFPRAVFKVKMGTQIMKSKKGKGAQDQNTYSRKAKHKKTTMFVQDDKVVFSFV